MERIGKGNVGEDGGKHLEQDLSVFLWIGQSMLTQEDAQDALVGLVR